MSTLIRRYRALLSSEVDDYFQDSDLVDHINDAKRSLVSTAIKLELDQPKRLGRSIRALNLLRVETTYNSLVFTPKNNFFQADLNVNGINPDNLLFIGAADSNRGLYMTELLANRRHEVNVGEIQPTEVQGYWYYFTDTTTDPDEKRIRIYAPAEDDTLVITVMHVKEPVVVTDTDEDLIDLPDRLIKAVCLKAAIDGANMEERTNTQNYLSMYQNELEVNLW